jgi:hypothetical protein
VIPTLCPDLQSTPRGYATNRGKKFVGISSSRYQIVTT